MDANGDILTFDQLRQLTQQYCAIQIAERGYQSAAAVLRSATGDTWWTITTGYEQDGCIYKERGHVKWRDRDVTETTIANIWLQQLQIKQEVVKGITDTPHKGKVLVCSYTEAIPDGASEAESEGFIDELDLPPVDTWICLRNSKLYAWIPEQYCNLVQEAIDVNALDILWWEDATDKTDN